MDMLTIFTTLFLLQLTYVVKSDLQESLLESNSACFGVSGPVQMNLNCQNGAIAIHTIYIGAKRILEGCPASFNATANYSSLCCEPSEDDCLFVYSIESNTYVHSVCNGRDTCQVNVQNAFTAGRCNSSYPPTTNYMYVQYYCIYERSINTMCSSLHQTTSGRTSFIWNNGFPSGDADANVSCTCSVEVNNTNSEIEIYTLQRVLEKNEDGECDQALSLHTPDGTPLATWTCLNNTHAIDAVVFGSSVVIFIVNNRSSSPGNFFLGFQASNPSASLIIKCPSEFPTTTTTMMQTATVPAAATTKPPSNKNNDVDKYAVVLGFAAIPCALFIALVVIFTYLIIYKHKIQSHTRTGNLYLHPIHHMSYHRHRDIHMDVHSRGEDGQMNIQTGRDAVQMKKHTSREDGHIPINNYDDNWLLL